MRRVRSLTVIAVGLAVVAPAASAASHTRYVGKKDGRVVTTLRLSGDRRVVTSMSVRYRVSCDNGGSATRSTRLTNLRVKSAGRFAFSGSYTGTADGSENRVKVRGHVTRRRASGTFRLSAEGNDPDTGDAVHCNSGTVEFSAKRVP